MMFPILPHSLTLYSMHHHGVVDSQLIPDPVQRLQIVGYQHTLSDDRHLSLREPEAANGMGFRDEDSSGTRCTHSRFSFQCGSDASHSWTCRVPHLCKID